MNIDTKNKKANVKSEAQGDKTGADWTRLSNRKYQKNAVK